ncbi:MAG: C45 family peptidase [Bacteroidota bacterium]
MTGTEVILTGGPRERGRQHGQLLGEVIRAFLRDDWARINRMRHRALADEQILGLARAHRAVVERVVPELHEELLGLAEGADIDPDEAAVLQYRREITEFENRLPLDGECSTLTYPMPDWGMLTGQTIDLAGDMVALGRVFRIRPTEGAVSEILMYGFAGLLGYMGMNDCGLAVNINFVQSEGWKTGISPYLAVRAVLACSDLETALGRLRALPLASSRCLTLTYGGESRIVEMTPEACSIEARKRVAHTNHYLIPERRADERMHFLFMNSSRGRQSCLEALLADDLPRTPQSLLDAFRDHSLWPVGLCAHAEGNLRRSDTVATVVMAPEKGQFWARPGHACEGIARLYQIEIQPHRQ